jgi:hypothetical protein
MRTGILGIEQNLFLKDTQIYLTLYLKHKKRNQEFHFESQYGNNRPALSRERSIRYEWDSMCTVQRPPYGTSSRSNVGRHFHLKKLSREGNLNSFGWISW